LAAPVALPSPGPPRAAAVVAAERSVPESADEEQLEALELSRLAWLLLLLLLLLLWLDEEDEELMEEAEVSAYVSEDRPESTEMYDSLERGQIIMKATLKGIVSRETCIN
jgi:hypothetical protein